MGIAIREAQSEQDRRRVWKLTHDVYVADGLAEAQPSGMLKHYPRIERIDETCVLIAEDAKGDILGTISYTLDGPFGLHVDYDFASAMQEVRATLKPGGLNLCAVWRVVVHPEARRDGVLTQLMERALMECWALADAMVCSFHPRHEAVYRRLFGFDTWARAEHCPSVNGAPGVLMFARTAAMAAHYMTRKRNPKRLARD